MTTHEAVKAARLDGAAMLSDTTQTASAEPQLSLTTINEMEYPKINPFKEKRQQRLG